MADAQDGARETEFPMALAGLKTAIHVRIGTVYEGKESRSELRTGSRCFLAAQPLQEGYCRAEIQAKCQDSLQVSCILMNGFVFAMASDFAEAPEDPN